MRARKDRAVRPARRQVTFAWPVAAALAVFAAVALRWPRAPYTPVCARPPQAPAPAMAYVEIPPGATLLLWPRDFSQGLLDNWPRALDTPPPAQTLPPPPAFREWPADENPPPEARAE